MTGLYFSLFGFSRYVILHKLYTEMGKKHWKEESRISRQRNKYSCREYKLILSSSFNSYMNDCFLHIYVRIHFWSMSSKLIVKHRDSILFQSYVGTLHNLYSLKTCILKVKILWKVPKCLWNSIFKFFNDASYNEFVKMAYRGLILVNLIKMVLNVI